MPFSFSAFLTRKTSPGLSSTRTMRAVFDAIDSLLGRDHELEVGALPELRIHPNAPPEALHHVLAERQADTGAGGLLSIQAVKHAEDFLRILRFDADAIVLCRKNPLPQVILPGRDVNLRGLLAPVLD